MSAEARRERARAALAEAVAALRTSEGWRRWLAVRARFHRYSANNTLLIASQKPNATRVAGFRAWQALGYQVKKGTKGALIFVPHVRVQEDPETGEEVRRLSFGTAHVFDLADVEEIPGEAQPLDAPGAEIGGDSLAGAIPKLVALAGQIGYRVRFEHLPGSTEGYADRRNRLIVCTPVAPNAQVRVLVHELAHALGVGYEEYGRANAEVICDAAAYVVVAGLGLDIAASTAPYVAGWSEAAEEKLAAYAETIDRIARRIEEAVHGAAAGREREGAVAA